MFIKIVIVLLLLIVAASLLAARGDAARPVAPSSRLRPMMKQLAFVLLLLSAVAAVLHLAGCSPNPNAASFHATEIREASYGRLATLDSLTDHTGRRLASPEKGISSGHADFSGQAVVVFFGYTQCPDICPTALATMKEAMRLLGPAAARVKVLFVTVDPERDTQEVLASYVPWFDARFIGLRGDAATTLAVAKEFRVFYSKVEGKSAGGYSVDHTATSYAYDPQGRLRLLIRHGETPENIAADLEQLLAGK